MSRIKSEIDGTHHVIKLPSVINKEACEEFQGQSQTWLVMDVKDHVLDFSAVLTMNPSHYPCFVTFARRLRAQGKRMLSLHMKPDLTHKITRAGLYDVFCPVEEPSPPTAAHMAAIKFDVRFINPFLEAVQMVFSTQIRTELTAGKPFTPTETTKLDVGIVGLLALNSTQFRGNISICFPAAVFLKIYERMLGEKHGEISEEIEDAVAEILNIIYGTAKTVLNRDLGAELQASLPTVLRGEKLALRQQPGAKTLVLPFVSDLGTFHIEIATAPLIQREKRSA